jgi:cytochrome c-type biogenesis protein CcmF
MNVRIAAIATLGNSLIISLIIIVIVDACVLIVKKRNLNMLPLVTMMLSFDIFFLLVYSFVNDYFNLVYVWSYDSLSTPLVYKFVAIWAGESGSIITWMVLNSLFLFLYRVKTDKAPGKDFIASMAMATAITLVFIVIVQSLNPFQVDVPIFPLGGGLNVELQSPFMIWHPLFMFLAYAAFLIPFTNTSASILTRSEGTGDAYHQAFNKTVLKLGWLILTIGISLGAYWAKTTSNWGSYWDWDPVETVSLVPWFFSTSYFHAMTFSKKKKSIADINMILIFTSIVFSTLLVRGGGLISLHAFTGTSNLVLWVIIVGLFVLVASFSIIYKMLDHLASEYNKRELLVDDASYLFFMVLAFIALFGLVVTPFTAGLSTFMQIVPVSLNPNYFSTGELVPAIDLALSLIFCSLMQKYKINSITLIILVSIACGIGFSLVVDMTTGVFINPLISIYVLLMLATVLAIVNNCFDRKRAGAKIKFNGRLVVHAGISFILIGTLSGTNAFQDFAYFTGFFILVGGMVLSILVDLARSRKITEVEVESTHVPADDPSD